MFIIEPKSNRQLDIGEVTGNDLEILKQLADRLKPMYEKIIVENKTKTCRVQVVTTNRNLYLVITNEEEDTKFRLTE